MLDCFFRERLFLRAEASYPAYAVERELEWLFLIHEKPQGIVSDKGPEFRAMSLPEGIENRFMKAGKLWQDGYIESFFGKLRDELLSFEVFERGADLQLDLTEFQDRYNNHRSHLALGGLTPAAYKESLKTNNTEEILQV